MQHHELSIRACTLAGGCTAAIATTALAVISIVADPVGTTMVSILSDIAPGFRPSIPGAVLGSFWTFLEGSALGYVFASLHNTFVRMLHS